MRPGIRIKKILGLALIGPCVWLAASWDRPSRGDEPGSRLGRLFRFGGNNANSNHAGPVTPSPFGTVPASRPYPAPNTPGGATPSLIPPPSTAATSAPLAPASADASTRLVPQPRVSRSVTESDPILTRTAVARASDGAQFCDFMQVYADGTVLDGGGIHHVNREALKPLIEAIQGGEVFRLRGHCGGPPADFIEQVHVVVYERSLGRLRANSFSYSGNTQGCDHAIKHLQTAIESIQTKISGPMMTTTTPAASPGGDAIPLTAPSGNAAPAAPSSNARPIPLTPLN